MVSLQERRSIVPRLGTVKAAQQYSAKEKRLYKANKMFELLNVINRLAIF